MDFIRFLLSEDPAGPATSAGDVSVVQTPIGVKPDDEARLSKPKKRKLSIVNIQPPFAKQIGFKQFVKESGEDKFDAVDVSSKIRAARKANEIESKSVVYGLQDADGHVIKVYVTPDQAEDFETALADALADDEHADVAEVLFSMKDRFDILHVEWPTEEEENNEEDLQGADQNTNDSQLPDQSTSDDEIPAVDDTTDLGVEDQNPIDDSSANAAEVAASTLDKVIMVLQANASAQQAEAEARAAEAKAKEAEAAADLARTKMNAEIEVLDMESWEKQQKQKKQEASLTKRMATFKHETQPKPSSVNIQKSVDVYRPDDEEEL